MTASTTCSRCDRGSVVELEMKAKTGQVLAMSSCTRCETRTWTADGQAVSRDEVLRITSGNPDFEVVQTPKKVRRARTGG